jgi:hypothetical protein
MRIALVVVVIAIVGTAFVFHERKSMLEHRLASVASQIAARPVHVHCQGVAGDLVDVTSEAGTVQFDASGRPANVTDLKRPICDALRRFSHDAGSKRYGCVLAQADCPASIFEDVLAVHTLTHESWHLHGDRDESVAECHALQTTAFAATLLGADDKAAQATAAYALVRLYPNLPDEYRSGACVNGGPMDLRPTDPHWP